MTSPSGADDLILSITAPSAMQGHQLTGQIERGAFVEHDSKVEVNRVLIPKLGFGTWLLYGKDASEAVRDALHVGYRHIDTARLYDNEYWVGRGIRESGVARDDVFLTTKVYGSAFWSHLPQTLRTVRRDALRWAVEDSLMRLDTEYLDLLLLHWPSLEVPLEDTLTAMGELRDEGWVRQIGVSNFPPSMLRQACELAPIFCNQVEYHPFLGQDRLLAVARELGVLISAHSPLCAGLVLRDKTLQQIGAMYRKSAVQVALRWLIDQPGVCTIPTATTQEWRRENLDIFDFRLSEEDDIAIRALPKDVRAVEAPFALDWDV